jgi:hypothetical protein
LEARASAALRLQSQAGCALNLSFITAGAQQVQSDLGAGAMTQATTARAIAQIELADRIDRIATALPHMTTASLAFAIDDIRRAASSHDLRPLAALARGLENAIAESSGATMILPYLEAMSDAVACDSIDPAVASIFLASVGLRIHG